MWWHIDAEIADFQMPTYELNTGAPIDVLRTGSHPHMLLYVLNELFNVYRGVGEMMQMDIVLLLTESSRQHRSVAWSGIVAKRRSVTLLGLLTQG